MRLRLAIPMLMMTTPTFAQTSITPTPGIYNVSNYVLSASATNGGACNYKLHEYYTDTYFYPGPGKPGAVAREFFSGPGLGYVDKLEFPTTPLAGATSQSGTYTATVLPGGTPTTGTFTTNFTIIDTSSWVATATYVYPVSTTSMCTTTYQEVVVRSGK